MTPLLENYSVHPFKIATLFILIRSFYFAVISFYGNNSTQFLNSYLHISFLFYYPSTQSE